MAGLFLHFTISVKELSKHACLNKRSSACFGCPGRRFAWYKSRLSNCTWLIQHRKLPPWHLDCSAAHPQLPNCDRSVQGVPIRLELGPRDMAGGVCMSARRDTGVKASISWADLPQQIPQLLDTIQVTAAGGPQALLSM